MSSATTVGSATVACCVWRWRVCAALALGTAHLNSTLLLRVSLLNTGPPSTQEDCVVYSPARISQLALPPQSIPHQYVAKCQYAAIPGFLSSNYRAAQKHRINTAPDRRISTLAQRNTIKSAKRVPGIVTKNHFSTLHIWFWRINIKFYSQNAMFGATRTYPISGIRVFGKLAAFVC